MEEQFLALLEQFRRRLRYVESATTALRWAVIGCWAGVLVTALLKLFDADPGEQWNGLWLAVVVLLGGFVFRWSRPPSLRRTALLTDQKHQLEERLTSALDQQLRPAGRTLMSQFLLRDALSALQERDPLVTFPLFVGRPLAAILPAVLVIWGLTLLPTWSEWLHRIKPAEQRAVRRSADRLGSLAQHLQQKNPKNKRVQALARRLQQQSQQLQKAGVSRVEAAKQLKALAQQIRQEQASAQHQAGQGNKAEQALKAMKESPASAEKTLREQLSKAQPGSLEEKRLKEALDKLQSDPQGAQKALEQLKSSQEEGAEESEAAERAEDGLSSESESLDPDQKSTSPGKGQGSGKKGEGPQENRGAGQSSDEPGGKTDKGDFGRGSTNKEQKPEDGSSNGPRLVRQMDNHKPIRQETFERLYEAERRHFDSEKVQVKGQRRQGRLIKGQGFSWGKPSQGGPSELAPSAPGLEIQAGAEEAVVRGEVPAAYRTAVKNYFQGQ